MATTQSFTPLNAITPIDGRYRKRLKNFSLFFSEEALMRYRVGVEISYVLFLSKNAVIPKLSSKELHALQEIRDTFSSESAKRVKEIEQITKHDVKAVEYFIQEEIEKRGLQKQQFIHIALTSEDVNAIAYGCMLSDADSHLIYPALKELVGFLTEFALQQKDLPMLARTHGQPAVPTTFGKELMVFAMRLHTQLQELSQHHFEAKMSGAVGNFNAHLIAFPDIDWIELSKKFVQSFGLKPNLWTTQILPAENHTSYFQILQRMNIVLLDLSQDVWRYISDEYLLQKVEKNQVGSSTMPQKINPIDFENCEGNLGMANALLQHFVTKLGVSRLQRDLSDSTVKRNIGTAFAYCVLGYQSCLHGLKKIMPNNKKMHSELENHWEVIAEGIQTVLRVSGDADAYEKLRQFSQGKKLTQEKVNTFVQTLNVTSSTKKRLLQITPETYLGIASQLVRKGYNLIKGASYGKHEKV